MKSKFFDKLHQDLGERYNLTKGQVATLRQFLIYEKEDTEEIIHWAMRKTKAPKSITGRSHSAAYYQRIVDFLTLVPEQVIKDLAHKTHYDREENGL